MQPSLGAVRGCSQFWAILGWKSLSDPATSQLPVNSLRRRRWRRALRPGRQTPTDCNFQTRRRGFSRLSQKITPRKGRRPWLPRSWGADGAGDGFPNKAARISPLESKNNAQEGSKAAAAAFPGIPGGFTARRGLGARLTPGRAPRRSVAGPCIRRKPGPGPGSAASPAAPPCTPAAPGAASRSPSARSWRPTGPRPPRLPPATDGSWRVRAAPSLPFPLWVTGCFFFFGGAAPLRVEVEQALPGRGVAAGALAHWRARSASASPRGVTGRKEAEVGAGAWRRWRRRCASRATGARR